MIITNDSVREIIQDMFESNDKKMTIYSEETQQGQLTTLKECLNPYFYTYQKNELTKGFYGANEEEQSNYIETIARNMQTTMCLVEVGDTDILASPNIDGGTFKATLTFFIPTDKIAILDYYVNYLRDIYKGKYDTLNDEYDLIVKIGELVIQDYATLTNIGMANICTLDIDFGYMQMCSKYLANSVQMSLDGETFTNVPLTKCDIAVQYTNNLNTSQNNPKHVGDIITSATFGLSLSYYDFTSYSHFATIKDKALSICSTNYDSDLNNIIYIKLYDKYIYKMVIRAYSESLVNTDFTSVSLTLGISALE
jgi:hypothetical protein